MIPSANRFLERGGGPTPPPGGGDNAENDQAEEGAAK